MEFSEKPKFPNPNYQPEKWGQETTQMEKALTGVPILDAANKLKQKIIIDVPTGCLNRAYYDNFETHFDYQRTNDSEIAIIFLDLNDLKKINDNLGHIKGDEFINMLVQFLKDKFRKGDEIVRFGGDEFLVICHNHDNDPQFKMNLQDKIKKIQAEFHQQLISKKIPSLGFAAGLAVFDKDTDLTLNDVLNRADLEMYKNKESMKRTTPTSDII